MHISLEKLKKLMLKLDKGGIQCLQFGGSQRLVLSFFSAALEEHFSISSEAP
jgi:hypothetical protein